MSYVSTYCGHKFDILSPDPAKIVITDIAHHLSQVNRFGGAARWPISVAQHSVYVSRLCDGTPHAMQGLLHDASEAYLGDIPKWVKETSAFEEYRKLEKQIQDLIFEKFDCATILAPKVRDADTLMVRFEAWQACRQVFKHMPKEHFEAYGPPTQVELDRVGVWSPWGQQEAREAFVMRFLYLQKQRLGETATQLNLF